MPQDQSANSDRRATSESDNSSDDAGLYYYVFGSGSGSGNNGNFANGYYEHNPNGAADDVLGVADVVIDFDTGVLTVDGSLNVDAGDGYYYGSENGTYSEDGFTLAWASYDYYYGSENAYNLGVPVFDASSSNNDHANYNADDYVFGYNYTSDNIFYADQYEYTHGVLSDDAGTNFNLEGLDVVLNGGPNDVPDYFSIYTDSVNNDVFEYAFAYTFDAQDWFYTGSSIDEILTADSLDDVLDLGFFDDVNQVQFFIYGDFAIDNIELDYVV